MWIVSLVLVGLKYHGAIDLDWVTVLVFAMSPVWLPLAFAYFLSRGVVRSTRSGRARKRTNRRRSPSLF